MSYQEPLRERVAEAISGWITDEGDFEAHTRWANEAADVAIKFTLDAMVVMIEALPINDESQGYRKALVDVLALLDEENA